MNGAVLRCVLVVLFDAFGFTSLLGVADAAPPAELGKTLLGIEGSQFTLNGTSTFLLGFSYFGALGAPEESVRKDLNTFHRHGFNLLRVWATWSFSGEDVSAVDTRGEPREPFLRKLQWLVTECNRRGLVVDVTLARGEGASAGGRLSGFEAHERAVETLVRALSAHQNWYLDLANEHDVRDERYVSASELKTLRELIRKLDPGRLVTASYGGHDLRLEDVRTAIDTVGVDFLCPHRPRNSESPAETEAQARACLALLNELGRQAPILYQEPFRRGYAAWEPKAEDFLSDLRSAVAGGAAGWCFHNGAQRGASNGTRGRSFDLRNKPLFDQLDEEELRVVQQASTTLPASRAPR